MDDAALVFVREDSIAAERLAVALERAGVSVCRSASVFEDPQAYAAVVALFSPAAVRSRLVMEAALRAREESRIVPVFVGLCPLPQSFSGIAMFDLSSWGGNADDAVVAAVATQIKRTKQVRTTRSGLEKGMAGARAAEPQGLLPPPAINAHAPAPSYAAYAPITAMDDAAYGAPATAFHHGFSHAPIPVQAHAFAGGHYPSVAYAAPQDAYTHFGYAPHGQAQPHVPPHHQTYVAPNLNAPEYAGVDLRPHFVGADAFGANATHQDPRFTHTPQHPAPSHNPRRFAGLTPADDSNGAPGWADAWVAAELRNRGVAHGSVATAAAAGEYNRHAYQGLTGAGVALPPSAPATVSPPTGNSFDAPVRGAKPDRWARDDRYGFERPAGTQDPFGAPVETARGAPRKRNDTLFAALLAVGLAAGAAGAMVFAGGESSRSAQAPAIERVDVAQSTTVDDTLQTAPVTAPITAPDTANSGNPARPEPLRVQAVSLREALGDAEKAKAEPSKSNAGADRGVERRRR